MELFQKMYMRHYKIILIKKYIYVTSSDSDPMLSQPPPGITSFFIGSHTARTFFFAGLEADIVVMTMPDLQTFHIKRSPYPVKYVYLHQFIGEHSYDLSF